MTVMEAPVEINTFTKKKIPVPSELRCLADGESNGNDECIFRILSQEKGDERVVWRRNSIPEINAAKKLFTDLIAQGMVPHKVGLDGRATAEVMKEFDPTAGEVIFMPIAAVVGG